MPNVPKKYRLTLDFTVWINDEILQPYSDEDELDKEEQRQLQAQRSLLKMGTVSISKGGQGGGKRSLKRSSMW